MSTRPRREKLKTGRRALAEIVTLPDGRRYCELRRSLKDIFRGKGNGYIAHALEEETAAWSIETLVLSKLKSRGIPFVVIRVRETGAIYATSLARFIEHSDMRNPRRRNSSMQRTLSFEHWKMRAGLAKI